MSSATAVSGHAASQTKRDQASALWKPNVMLSGTAGEPDMIMMILQSAGASLFDAEGKPAIAGNAALKKAIELYNTMVKKGIFVEVTGWDGYIATLVNGHIERRRAEGKLSNLADGLLRSLCGTIITTRATNTHQGRTGVRNNGANIGKVEVDQTMFGDKL